VNGRKRRPGFITLHREAISDMRKRLEHNRRAMALLIELLAEADAETGEIVASLRWLAAHLGMGRNTLVRGLDRLSQAGFIEVVKARSGHEGSIVTVVEYEWLVGMDGSSSSRIGSELEPVTADSRIAGSVAGSDMEPAARVSGSTTGSVAGSTTGSNLEPANPHLAAGSGPLDLQELQDLQDGELQESKAGSDSLRSRPREDSEPTIEGEHQEQELTEEEKQVLERLDWHEAFASSDPWRKTLDQLRRLGVSDEVAVLDLARAWVADPRPDRRPTEVLRPRQDQMLRRKSRAS
jgi:DNA-binding transcriptional regulator YhcF (GntR family)